MSRTPKQTAARTKSQRCWRRRKRLGQMQVKVDTSATTRRWAAFSAGLVKPDQINDADTFGENLTKGLAKAAKARKKFV